MLDSLHFYFHVIEFCDFATDLAHDVLRAKMFKDD